MDTPDESGKLVIVSNRLPTSLHVDATGAIELRDTVGGLATALSGARESMGFTWIGWPGPIPTGADIGAVTDALRGAGYEPVPLSPADADPYYNGMCNSVIWPLFHYFLGRVSSDPRFFAAYTNANQEFATTIARVAPPDAHVWIHDFHLMLVPSMLRALRPDVRISFFLHIPFPSSEVYRILPARAELLRGVLGADYIGFHTGDYVRHFRSSCLRVLGLESRFDELAHDGRRIGLGVHPIGADVQRLTAALRSEACATKVAELRERWQGRRVILGVERLDYSKAVPLKLAAYEEFLRRDPQRAKDNVLVQVLVPSRLDTEEYRDLKDEVELAVGRINGLFGAPGSTPIEYLHRSFDIDELAAMYRVADVGVVTPARDGMNLVAHEFVLCQSEPLDDDAQPGVLLLSEFAGASHSLSHVLLTNPWDTGGVADALEQALAMDPRERAERMAKMRERVLERDCQRWAERFLATAAQVTADSVVSTGTVRIDAHAWKDLATTAMTAERRVLLLDYDGTLREVTQRPGDARPTPEILELLGRLAALPRTEVHIVSGRDRFTLEHWLGHLPVHLSAEHGAAWRVAGTQEWQVRGDLNLEWLPRAEQILRAVEIEVDDSEIERKPAGIAWHYRRVDADYGEWRARELLVHLAEQFANEPVELLQGRKLVELRAAGINKGSYVRSLDLTGAFVLAIGDDRTDFDTYSALDEAGVAVHVGSAGEGNRYWVSSPVEVRALLGELAKRLG
jgi:trehalose 6-phosphate synthase/phosphatase